MVDVRNDVVVLRETIKRVDLSLYRLHGNGKAIQEDIRGLQDQVKKTERLPSVVQHLKQEVDNLLFQLPTGQYSACLFDVSPMFKNDFSLFLFLTT